MMGKNTFTTIVWVILSISVGIVPSLGIILNRNLINSLSNINSINDVFYTKSIKYLIYIAVMNLLLELLNRWIEYLYLKNKASVSLFLEKNLYKKILGYSLDKFECHNTYNKIILATQGINMNSLDMLKISINMISNMLSLISIFIVLSTISIALPISLIIAAVPSSIIIIFLKKYRYKIRLILLECLRKTQYLSSLFVDKRALKEIRIFFLAKHLLNSWQEKKIELIDAELKVNIKENKIQLLGSTIIQCCITLLSIYIVNMMSINKITIGDYVSLISAMTLFQSTLGLLSQNGGTLYEMKIYLDAMIAVLNEVDNKEMLSKEINNNIRFESLILKNISYKYPQSDQEILQDINLEINKGDKIAIVGYNGSGKTTLVKLLLGIYESYQGNITFNGKNIKDKEQMNMFRRVVSCVLQDFVKYNLTLRENIALGKIEDINNDKKIVEMLGKVDLSKKYVDMLDEMISVEYREGFELSGGEWQKIALARAIMSDADLIIMDEPTSSLDPVAEMNFLDYFNEQLINKTSILVSHRLGISRHCNKIIVMDDGKIVEIGSHDELMEKSGLYKTLFELQASKYV